MKATPPRGGFGRGLLLGLFSGLFLGLVLGASGMAVASLTAKGWARFSEDFRTGYVHGFLDMANLARNLYPSGYIDERYPLWPKVRPLEWKLTVDELYRNPENERFNLSGIMQMAGRELEKKHGKAPTPIERSLPVVQAFAEAAKKREEEAKAKALAEGKPWPPPPPAKPATPPADPFPKKRKRCPCPEEPADAAKAADAKPAK